MTKSTHINSRRNWLLAASCLLAAFPLTGQTAATPDASHVVVPPPQSTPSANSTTPDSATTQVSVFPSEFSHGQATSAGKVVLSNLARPLPALPPAIGTLVDQVIAVVNGELVLESDVDEERRFMAFEPFSTAAGSARDKIIDRLIDRTLILQQSKLQPDQGATKEEVDKQLQSLRKDLPECKRYNCDTAEGWNKFIAAQGFTKSELDDRWMQRVQILRFIELRFRAGVDITPAEIKDYYDKTMLPAYAKANATAPKLDVLSERIQEVLLEQRVSALLSDWLQSLKAEGTVRVMRPGEVEP